MNSSAQSLSQFLGFRYGMGRYPDMFVRHGSVSGYSSLVIGYLAEKIEWAERLLAEALSGHLELRLKMIDENTRRIDIFAYGHQSGNLLKALEIKFQDMIKS